MPVRKFMHNFQRSRHLLLATLIALVVTAAPAVGRGSDQSGVQPYIVVLADSAGDPGKVARDHAHRYGARVKHLYRHALKGYAATLSPDRLAALRADPRVEFVSEDAEVRLHDTCPLDTTSGFPQQCIPPGVDRVEADLSGAAAGDGSGSVDLNVAVVDDGIDLQHPDLNVVGGVNCSTGRGFDAVDYHGTFVAGIIGAKDNAFGVVGVAPGVRLWSIRVFGSGENLTGESTLLCGIDFMTSTRTDADPTNDIAVANLSLGGKGSDDGACGGKHSAIHRAICRSVALGVTYVVSAGNDGRDFATFFPASYDEVLTSTAIGDFDGRPGARSRIICSQGESGDDGRALFSNFAVSEEDRAHTFASPGACVVSTVPVGFFLPDFDTAYGISSGTSFSAPHLAGIVALCIANGACAGLTPAEIATKLRHDAEARTQGDPDFGFYGDPIDPEKGRFFGYLVSAEGY